MDVNPGEHFLCYEWFCYIIVTSSAERAHLGIDLIISAEKDDRDFCQSLVGPELFANLIARK